MKQNNKTDAVPANGVMKKVFLHSIRTRMIFVFCLLFAAVIVAIQVIELLGLPLAGYEGRIKASRIEAFHDLSLVADLKKTAVLSFMNHRCADIKVAAGMQLTQEATADLVQIVHQGQFQENGGFRALVARDAYKRLNRYCKSIVEAHDYEMIQLADSTGLLFFSTRESDLGKDVSGARYFEAGMSGHQIYVDDSDLGSDADGPILYISSPVKDGAGNVIAVLIFGINTEDMLRPILHTGGELGQTGEALLIDRNVTILTSLRYPLPSGKEAIPRRYRITAKPAVLAASGQEGSIESEDYRGIPVLAAYRYIHLSSDWGWGMVVKFDRDELFAPIYDDVRMNVYMGIGSILLMILFVAFATQRMIRPLRRLSQTAARIGAGERGIRCEVNRKDEIGQLASTLDIMSAEIEASLATLEDTVQERTVELQVSNQQLAASNQQLSATEQQLRASNQQLSASNQQFAASNQQLSATEQQLRASNQQLRATEEELLKYQDQLRALSSESMFVEEEERKRISELLHDDVCQILGLIMMKLHEMRSSDPNPETMTNILEACEMLERAIHTTRTLMSDLRPTLLYDLGLEAAVGKLVKSMVDRQEDIKPIFEDDDQPKPLGDNVRLLIYQSIRELLLNITSHAKASNVKVSMKKEGSNIRVVVEDDGIGFDVSRAVEIAGRTGHLGLFSIRERMRNLGGNFEVESEADRGTRVTLLAPLGE